MEVVRIIAKNDSPSVLFDPKKGFFEIRGNSMPENVRDFYTPILNWLNMYLESPNSETEFIFQMNLLNTSSTKIFIEIFKKINAISEISNVKISWYYNYGDDEMQELGTDFKEFTKVPFELIPVSV